MALINKEQEYQDQEAWSNDVQKLKGYKELVEKVEYWAEQKVSNNFSVIDGSYEILWDDKLGWCVDVDGDVEFRKKDIGKIPIQFRNVNGYFDCDDCKYLTSLEGCPVYVYGYFSCGGCLNLTSLKYCPKKVDGEFWCINCGKYFTEEYIRYLCDVKGKIYN